MFKKSFQEIIKLANKRLVNLGTNATIVNAVKEQNSMIESLDKIKALDENWHETVGIADYMRPKLESSCSQSFSEIHKEHTAINEILVLDSQGILVAASIKTEHYWYGDTLMFKEAYAGRVYISDAEFHTHDHAYVVQVALPVKNSETVIGVLSLCIDLDASESEGHDHEHHYEDDHDHERSH